MIEMIVSLGVFGLYVAVAVAVSSKRHDKVSLAQVSKIVRQKSKLGRDRFEGSTSSLMTAPELPVEVGKPEIAPSAEKLSQQKEAPVALKFALK